VDVYSSPVSKYMIKKVITATVRETIQSACKNMYENNVGCLVILKRIMSGPIPVGIITERDIVKIIGSSDLFIGRVAIREFMSSPLITVSSNTTMSQAVDIMNTNKIRRLPIISKHDDNDKLVGIISDRDILEAIGKSKKD
jgi:CBS domain-containing protein